MSNSINNAIPFVPENTIDPAAGLNEAINIIDMLLQLRVLAVKQNAPPGSPALGDRYIVGTSPTGAWTGQSLKLAAYADGGWVFRTAWVAVSGTSVYINTGSDWVPSTAGSGAAWGGISGTLADQTDLAAALGGKEASLTAGSNITIDRTDPDNPVISASGGGGSGGMTNPMTTAGDIITGGAAGAAQRLAAGVDGQRLTMVSGAPAWAYDLGTTITESTTSRTAALTGLGNYIRFTNASASAFTIPPQSSVAWPADSEIHVRRAAAGNLTLTPGSGVTLNAPSGGSLVLTNAMTVTLKRVAADVWDVIGQTVPA